MHGGNDEESCIPSEGTWDVGVLKEIVDSGLVDFYFELFDVFVEMKDTTVLKFYKVI